MIVIVPMRAALGFAATLSVACAAIEVRAEDSSPWQRDAHSAVRLLAGSRSGGVLLGGIDIQLQPGWKTYWRTPGDSGVPPRFDFSKSDNVQAVTVLWPAPTKFDDGVVLAAEGVPVGDYARQALKNAGILAQATANVVSNEDDDASVVAKVTSGDADAAIVYTSDVVSAGNGVRSVPIPSAVNVIATYPIAVVGGSAYPDQAKAFLDYVVGPTGQATLATFGFGPPSG